MAIETKNPFTNEVEKRFEEWSESQVAAALDQADAGYQAWKGTSIKERSRLMQRVADLLRENKEAYAKYPSIEMGRLFRESRDWEVATCADIAEYYAKNAKTFLAPQKIDVAEGEAYVESHPIGVLLGVMPWNFPYYRVLRFVAPNIMAGNVCLIKHASNVPQCAIALESLFREAGFPEGVYTNLLISARMVEMVLDDKRLRGVSLTGSEAAGSKVAAHAGKQLKKAVMELGGSDPFIVLEDANVEKAVDAAMTGKMFNCGRACVGAKRFIVLESVAEEFIEAFKNRMEKLEPGDPMDERTGFAPMSSEAQAQEVLAQVEESVRQGAQLLLGGDRPGLPGAFVNPTMLIDIKPGMPAYDQEIFGPVASIFVVKDEDEAVAIANATDYGLGSAIMSENIERAKKLSTRLDVGMVHINTYSTSQPDIPFGGVKRSGFGRELSNLGIEEFINKKLVRIIREI